MEIRRPRRGPSRSERADHERAVRLWAETMRTRLLRRLSSLEGPDRAKAVGATDAFEVFASERPPARATYGPGAVDEVWRDDYRDGYLEAFELVAQRRRELDGP